MFFIYLTAFVLGVVVGFIIKDKIITFYNWVKLIISKIKAFFSKGV